MSGEEELIFSITGDPASGHSEWTITGPAVCLERTYRKFMTVVQKYDRYAVFAGAQYNGKSFSVKINSKAQYRLLREIFHIMVHLPKDSAAPAAHIEQTTADHQSDE